MYDLTIVGAGPAGLTAGIYAGRFCLDTLILEKVSVGGQIVLSEVIENFPGFPGGVSTQELIDRIKKQIDDLGVNIAMEEVIEIVSDNQPYLYYNIKTQENVYKTKSVIVASGAQPKRLGIIGEEKFIGRGVSYCATCDGPLYKNKDVVVVGGGDRAVEEAIFLTRYVKKVTLVHRRQELRASKILEKAARQNPKIDFILDSIVEEIIGQNQVEAVKVRNVKTASTSILSCQGVFIFVGIVPNTNFIRNLLQVDEAGFIIVDKDMHSSHSGIFACGDCIKKSLYQMVTACAEGAQAANSAYKYITNL